jgi:transposase-like protein
MAPGKARDERKEQQWRHWIARWQKSGLTVTAFCARHDLRPTHFYAWRRTLQRRDNHPIPFVPVQLLAESAPASALEVVLATGRVVRVPPGFDAATLRQLLAVLGEDLPC